MADNQPARQLVDLNKYATAILSTEDLPLFDDAIRAANAGALRASYIMIWLACAESLKRRFREARALDHLAGKINHDVADMETRHQAVDKLLLNKAYEYGLLSDSERTVLNHVYEMRCLYGHPYEEAPSGEALIHAASAVVDLVLSRPVKLRYGFGEQILGNLLQETNYLDDQETAVIAFAKSVLSRLDGGILKWFMDKYITQLNDLFEDPSMAIIFRRGTWFCRAIIKETDMHIFTEEEWHDRCNRFPRALMYICSVGNIFEHMGEHAQNSVVGAIIEESEHHINTLKCIEQLSRENALSDRHEQRFRECVSGLSLDDIRISNLSTKISYGRLIESMESYNWENQNLAVLIAMSNGPCQATDLTEEQQLCLGRNMLQSAQGGAWEAIEVLRRLPQIVESWPFPLVRGLLLESFTNEKDEIRLKIRHLRSVLSSLEFVNSIPRQGLINEVVTSIERGVQKGFFPRGEPERVISTLKEYPWAESIAKTLEEKSWDEI